MVLWGATLLLGGLLLGGCLPSSQSQFDEEKEFHYLAGKSRVNGMDFKGAIESFQKALEVNPHSAAAHFELGWLNDQKERDAAVAIYHYSQYLRLRPKADNIEMVNTRILACKQELARTVSLGPVTAQMQKDLEQLTEENRRLKQDLEQLKAYAAQLQLLTNRPPPVTIINPRTGTATGVTMATGNLSSLGSNSTLRLPPVGSTRTHTVKPSETLANIARSYGVKLDALKTANPRVDPRKLRVGQTIVIPSESVAGPR